MKKGGGVDMGAAESRCRWRRACAVDAPGLVPVTAPCALLGALRPTDGRGDDYALSIAVSFRYDKLAFLGTCEGCFCLFVGFSGCKT